MLCWHHVFPEMTHNELVGWTQPHHDVAVVLFRDKDDFFRTAKRMEICKEILIVTHHTFTKCGAKEIPHLKRLFI